MVDEKVYITDDGSEYILSEFVIVKDKRFLLLYDEKEDKIFIASETDGKLIFLDEDYPDYKEIFNLLYEKYTSRS